MSEMAILAEGIGKRYRLGHREPYKSLRDTLASAGRRPLSVFRSRATRFDQPGAGADGMISALRDVTFQVGHGETVGLIGRNGSGKSTLLKVLSRITEPTTGRVEVLGRVGTLLEVGTGFHPELSGRENIYLNGAILGMGRSEIKRKFDEIVAFAEIDKFLDTPMKRYSSGMYVRLAFAVAAHLEPDILLVDEVLAVGDSAFQRKCLGKLGDITSEGRTVIFVSHDMVNVSVLCRSAILLDSGRIVMQGKARDVVDHYVNYSTSHPSRISWDLNEAPGDHVAKLTAVGVCKQDRRSADCYSLTEPVVLTMEFVVRGQDVRLNPVFLVKNTLGTTIFTTSNYRDPRWGAQHYRPGRYRAECVVPAHLLNEGTYPVDAMLIEKTRDVRAFVSDAVAYTVYDDGSTRGDYVGPWDGIVRPNCEWRVSQC